MQTLVAYAEQAVVTVDSSIVGDAKNAGNGIIAP
jgi:hypothetical protein